MTQSWEAGGIKMVRQLTIEQVHVSQSALVGSVFSVKYTIIVGGDQLLPFLASLLKKCLFSCVSLEFFF